MFYILFQLCVLDREVSNKEKKDDNLEQKKPLLKNEDSQQTLRHENEGNSII